MAHHYNWIEGIIIALKILQNESLVKGRMSLKLYFITDLQTPIDDQLEAKKLLRQILSFYMENLFIYVLGPFDCNSTYTLKTIEDIEYWRCQMSFYKDDSTFDFKLLRKLVIKMNTLVALPHIGIPLSNFYKELWGMQPWNQPLKLVRNLQLSCSLRRLTNPSLKPKVSKKRMLYVHEYVDREDSMTKYKSYEVLRGFKLNEKFVPLLRSKFNEEKSFKLIGFVDKNHIPDIYLLNDQTFYLTNLDVKNPVMNTLVQVLAEQSKYALVRRKYGQKTFKPKFGVLLPTTTPKEHFIYKDLPMTDDILYHIAEKDVAVNEETDISKIESSANGYQTVEEYLNALDIDEHDNSQALATDLTYNPSIRKKIFRLTKFANSGEIKLTDDSYLIEPLMNYSVNEILTNNLKSLI